MFKLALITGASSGLGEAFARLLASKQVDLLLTGRDGKALENLALELQKSVAVEYLAIDLILEQERLYLLKFIEEKAPDLIFNNAGFGAYCLFTELTLQQVQEMIAVNVSAVAEIAFTAAQTLLKKGKEGVICNVSSFLSFFPTPTAALYSATKAFETILTLAAAPELKSLGIHMLVSCPGPIQTNFAKRALQNPSTPIYGPMMAKEKVALKIYRQICRKRRLCIFDGRFYAIYLFLKLMPQRLASWILMRVRKKHLH